MRSSGPPHPSFSGGMSADTGPVKMVLCKQAQLVDDSDGYSAPSTLFCDPGCYVQGSRCDWLSVQMLVPKPLSRQEVTVYTTIPSWCWRN